MNRDGAIVVFSGGQDSTTCLFWAMKNFKKVIAISYDYGQKHCQELECAKNITREYGIEHHILDLKVISSITNNSLTNLSMEVDEKINAGKLPNTYVEGRNMLFLTFAAVFAKSKNINILITGVSQSDFSGYPDCRDIFIKSLQVTLSLAMDAEFEIVTPLMWLDKEQTWQLADELNVLDVIRNRTITCYNGVIGDGCGKCLSCKLRNNGLKRYLGNKQEK